MFSQDMDYQLNGGFFMGCNEISKNQHCLVGGFNPSEKYLSVGATIPNIWKVIKFMFQTTNQLCVSENGVLYGTVHKKGHGIGDNFRTHRWI